MESIQNFDTSTIYGSPFERTGHFGVRYRGINFVKCPFDYVLYQMLLFEVKPDLIIEIGTHEGGGALYLADILEIIGSGEIHTIDLEFKKYSDLVETHPRIKKFFGGFQNYQVPQTLSSQGKKVIVIDDGSHKFDDVLAAFQKFNCLVGYDSYYIIEDGIMNFIADDLDNPHPAISVILEKNKDFTIDRYWCDFFGKNATFNCDGYLRRKKE